MEKSTIAYTICAIIALSILAFNAGRVIEYNSMIGKIDGIIQESCK